MNVPQNTSFSFLAKFRGLLRQVQKFKLVNKIDEDHFTKKLTHTQSTEIFKINPHIYRFHCKLKILQFNSSQFPPWVKSPIWVKMLQCFNASHPRSSVWPNPNITIFSGNFFLKTVNCHHSWTVRAFDLIPKVRARPEYQLSSAIKYTAWLASAFPLDRNHP